MYDAIIIGARCAGAATARLLARTGKRVLLLDRASFPSDTISGHFIMHPGVRALARWQLLDAVLASGCPPVNRFTNFDGAVPLSADITPEAPPVACIGPRRTILDQILVDAAVTAGAEFRDRTALTSLVFDDEAVCGVKLRTASGTQAEERASLVIGADGKHSLVARLVDAPHYGEVAPLTCWYMAYWAELPVSGLEAHRLPGRLALAFPTNDGLTMLAIGWRHEEFAALRTDVNAGYRSAAMAMPGLRERFASARQAAPYMAMADLPTFFRRPYGPGWALAGDAGHHKDPTNARGISDAFRDAELLASAVDAGLSGRQPMLQALAQYERLRNEDAVPENEFNLMAATLDQGAPQIALRRALQNQPADARRLFETIAGIRPWTEFFAPQNLGRILVGATAAAGAG